MYFLNWMNIILMKLLRSPNETVFEVKVNRPFCVRNFYSWALPLQKEFSELWNTKLSCCINSDNGAGQKIKAVAGPPTQKDKRRPLFAP